MPGRRAAFAALCALERDGEAHLDDVLELPADPRDAGLARELGLGACAWKRLYDALAARFLRQGRQPLELTVALRLCAHQLFALDRIPPRAAVATTVDLLHGFAGGRLCGVANAVCRRLSELRAERQGPGPLGRLHPGEWPLAPGVRHSLPDLLLTDLAPVCDADPARTPEDLNRLAPLCTRTRPGASAPVHPAIRRRDGAWCWWDEPEAALRGPVADGLAVVQDRAQGVVLDTGVAVGAFRPGHLVLDLCAAPGGKALALADRGCRVVAADRMVSRLRPLGRVAGAPASLLVQDGASPAVAGGFDAVLVDAPCSNSGVLARRPEARWRYDWPRLEALEALQRALLAAGAGLVRADGHLVYSTCSISPRENQRIVHELAGWRVLAEQLSWPDAWQAGGFVAVLVRS